MTLSCEQVSYYLEGLCGGALQSFIASDVTGAFAGLPLNCSTMNGANDRAAGDQQRSDTSCTSVTPAQLHLHLHGWDSYSSLWRTLCVQPIFACCMEPS